MSESNRSSENRKRITVSEKKPAQKGSTSVSSSAKSAKGKAPSKSAPKGKTSYTPPSEKIVHQILPFVWFVGALFTLACFVCHFVADENPMGFIGDAIYKLFFGLFGAGAFLIPAILVYYGVKHRRFVDERRSKVVLKTVLVCLTLLIFSALYQVFCKNPASYDIAYLWRAGVSITGGGVIGGSLGWLSYTGLKVVGSAIIMIAALIVIVPFIFNQTPLDIAEYIRRKSRAKREKRRKEEEARLVAERMREYEKDYEDEDRSDSSVTASPALAEDNRGGRIRFVKKDTKQRSTEEDDVDELFDDGLFDTIPEKKEETPEETAEIKTEEEPQAEEQTESAPVKTDKFTLKSVFDEKAISRMEAGDEDDGVDTFAPDAENTESGEVLSEEESEERAAEEEAAEAVAPWIAPTIELLVEDTSSKADLTESIEKTKRKLYETLASFGIRVKDIGCSIGPTITRYEVVPDTGVRVRAIANLVDDITMNLASSGVRVEAPIPNKAAVGIEVPNAVKATVRLRTLIDNEKFRNSSPLTVCLGQDVSGANVYFDIKKMPHMIIAGTTGSGKSVCINSIVTSLLYKNSPDAVKLVMIDPKKVEFKVYQKIPHLYCPIIIDPKKAAGALASAVAEMERRYSIIEDVGVRDVDSYNAMTAKDPDREYLPKLIIVIDELADLMMTAKADVEQFITRIAQKARAVGIHLIIGTQRPSVDVITGLIKANVPSRIACTVKSQVDSRTILDVAGAEKLIGRGDMLFAPIGMSKPIRVQGAFLEDEEVMNVVDFIRANNAPVVYNDAFMASMEAAAENVGEKKSGAALDAADMSEENGDAKFRMAVEIAIREGKVSTSLLQRKLEIGYGRAAKIIDRMEEMGYVSESDGNKPRRILITQQEFYESQMNKSSDGE